MFNFDIMSLIYIIPVILISLSFHEAAHAFVSYRLGDPTAQRMGRLTLNPLRHLDPMGTIMMIISSLSGMGFGWAKPVPINPTYYKNRKTGTILTSIAGPLSNLLLAFLATFPLLYLALKYDIRTLNEFDIKALLYNFSWMFFAANINLAVFNLMPIPPLDGSKILSGILPQNLYFRLMRYENYAGLIFIAIVLMFPNQFSSVLRFITDPIRQAFINIAAPIVSLFAGI